MFYKRYQTGWFQLARRGPENQQERNAQQQQQQPPPQEQQADVQQDRVQNNIDQQQVLVCFGLCSIFL